MRVFCRGFAARWLGCVAIVGSLIALASPAGAAVSVNGLFSDNAVLQRDLKLPVWGQAADGEKITVTLDDQKADTTAADGKWRVDLAPHKAGGPFTLTIEGPSNKIEAKNILIGDVWIAGGQSNMEMAVQNCANGPEEVKNSANPQIRLITIARKQHAAIPQTDIQDKWVECGPNTVGGFSGVAYFFGRDLQKQLNVPIGLINSNIGGTTAERWMSKESLEAETTIKDMPRSQGANDLYNAMIYPLIPYGIKGAIWYQGESNAGFAWQYRTLFPAMIKNWRTDWKQGDFPFFFVQLAPFTGIVNQPQDSQWAELRDAQLYTMLHSPKTGMAVITDVGDEKDIHPKRKQQVGARLAIAARGVAYGEQIEPTGPIFDRLEIKGREAAVHFSHLGGGLEAKGDKLTGFTVAGDDKKFHNAEAKIDGDTVVVSSDQVEKPVAVRFGWAQYPVVNLWSKSGLPASPFRSDEFPLTTQPKSK